MSAFNSMADTDFKISSILCGNYGLHMALKNIIIILFGT